MSDPTAYRRLERLREAGLVAEQQTIDADGNHYKRYVATVDEVTVSFEDGTYEVTVIGAATDPADRFTDLFEGLS
jgi:DNA-binding transcriptional ArsR family regulator